MGDVAFGGGMQPGQEDLAGRELEVMLDQLSSHLLLCLPLANAGWMLRAGCPLMPSCPPSRAGSAERYIRMGARRTDKSAAQRVLSEESSVQPRQVRPAARCECNCAGSSCSQMLPSCETALSDANRLQRKSLLLTLEEKSGGESCTCFLRNTNVLRL